jgi:hypothetical protein
MVSVIIITKGYETVRGCAYPNLAGKRKLSRPELRFAGGLSPRVKNGYAQNDTSGIRTVDSTGTLALASTFDSLRGACRIGVQVS